MLLLSNVSCVVAEMTSRLSIVRSHSSHVPTYKPNWEVCDVVLQHSRTMFGSYRIPVFSTRVMISTTNVAGDNGRRTLPVTVVEGNVPVSSLPKFLFSPAPIEYRYYTTGYS